LKKRHEGAGGPESLKKNRQLREMVVSTALDIYGVVDVILVPIVAIVYALTVFGVPMALLSAVAFVILINFFSLIFVSVLFLSIFVADLIVSKRVLRTADASTRMYVTLALTVILCVFFITVITGGLEPWQAFLIALVFHIFQARYRTSSLTMAQKTEIAEKRSLSFS